jgi:hypothetical protein
MELFEEKEEINGNTKFTSFWIANPIDRFDDLCSLIESSMGVFSKDNVMLNYGDKKRIYSGIRNNIKYNIGVEYGNCNNLEGLYPQVVDITRKINSDDQLISIIRQKFLEYKKHSEEYCKEFNKGVEKYLEDKRLGKINDDFN